MEAHRMHERIHPKRGDSPVPDWTRFLVRVGDVVSASALIVVLMPMIVAVAIFSYRPNIPLILRRQCSAPRGHRYTVYEFNAGDDLGEPRDSDSARDRPLRPLVRMFRGDQLPQLFNVIRGELSFFGGASRPRLFSD
jgi:lipopolysaccharide/colanic/teichoic acid biosynthesis glycosyltransferase